MTSTLLQILIQNQYENKDLVKENQRLWDRISILEAEIFKETVNREGFETEWNRLRNINLSQTKDLDNLRKQIAGLKKDSKPPVR